jgi:hypothetical protein
VPEPHGDVFGQSGEARLQDDWFEFDFGDAQVVR